MQPWTIKHAELRTLLSMMQPNLSRITRYWCMYLSHEEGLHPNYCRTLFSGVGVYMELGSKVLDLLCAASFEGVSSN